MEIAVSVLGGIVIGLISGAIGKYIGSCGKVDEEYCGERRLACNTLLETKFKAVNEKLDTILDHMDRSFKI